MQSVDALVLCPYSLTIGEYLCAYLALRVLFFGIFSLIGAVSAQFFDNYRPALVICAAIAVIGALTSGINQSSALYSLTKFSPGALANVNILFERYRGINFFPHLPELHDSHNSLGYSSCGDNLLHLRQTR